MPNDSGDVKTWYRTLYIFYSFFFRHDAKIIWAKMALSNIKLHQSTFFILVRSHHHHHMAWCT